MKRGDIYWANLPHPSGSRPVLIVTRDSAIPVLSAVVVAEVTRTIRKIRSAIPLGAEEGLPSESVANCDTLVTIRKDLFEQEPVGALSEARIGDLDRALRFALGIKY